MRRAAVSHSDENIMTESSLRHIAIIMDGNNRWAKAKGQPGIAGHRAGAETIRNVMEACADHHVDVLTLFAFSSENWRRPPKEVEALMTLFQSYLRKEAKKLRDQGVRLRVIGNRSRFSKRLLRTIEEAEQVACEGPRTLVIAADYGGRWDIANAASIVAAKVASGELTADAVDEDVLGREMALAEFPPLDLLIRTGGECRISNFLLWQSAYTEFYFTDTFWPDFDGDCLAQAVADFHARQRRFGRTGDQVIGARESA